MLDLSCIITYEKEKLFSALCPEIDISSQGASIEEAKKNLREAVELYLQDEDAILPQKNYEPIMTMIKVNDHKKNHAAFCTANKVKQAI